MEKGKSETTNRIFEQIGFPIDKKSENIKDLIFNFTILWNIYEEYYEKKCPNNLSSNINTIYDDLKKWTIEYNKEYKNTQVKFDEDLLNRFYGDNSKHTFKDYNSNGKIDCPKDVIEYIAYRVRCNLFHGNKEPFNLNGEKKLFICLNNYLSEVINHEKKEKLEKHLNPKK